MRHLLLYCRPGFENECAAEIVNLAEQNDCPGFANAAENTGYITFTPYPPNDALGLSRRLRFRELIFARQMIVSPGLLENLPADDRIAPLIAGIAEIGRTVNELRLEMADTNEGKRLSRFCKRFATPLRRALEEHGMLDAKRSGSPCLHLFFLDSATVYPGFSWSHNASAWTMGIPRFKLSASAPSRSALKLEEALQSLLTAQERADELRPGMRFVDLGAAPGGWSWVLARRQCLVTAVDNGPLDRKLLDSGMVEHYREDGFRFRPKKAVDWMVCDMADKPARIADLAAQWLIRGDCRHCIFNLKLPMKKRYAEVMNCIEIIKRKTARKPLELRLKHLYHDREEVTAYARLLD